MGRARSFRNRFGIGAPVDEVVYIGGPQERSGLVAFRDNCEQPGQSSVQITKRSL